jgi:hypothetical protein
VAPICLTEKPFGPYTGLYLMVTFLLASQQLDPTNRLADTPFNVLQSYLFFAAMAVLVLLFRLGRKHTRNVLSSLEVSA